MAQFQFVSSVISARLPGLIEFQEIYEVTLNGIMDLDEIFFVQLLQQSYARLRPNNDENIQDRVQVVTNLLGSSSMARRRAAEHFLDIDSRFVLVLPFARCAATIIEEWRDEVEQSNQFDHYSFADRMTAIQAILTFPIYLTFRIMN